MKVVQNQRFEDATIRLDDFHFVSCRFEACVLVYSGAAEFGLTNNCFAEDCTFRVDGVAASTIKALQALFANGEWGQQMVLQTLQDAVPEIDKLH